MDKVLSDCTLSAGAWQDYSGSITTEEGEYYLITMRAYFNTGGSPGKCSVTGGDIVLDFNGPLINSGTAGNIQPIAIVRATSSSITVHTGNRITAQSIHYVKLFIG